MMFFNQTAPAARTALIYITLGSLLMVWTAIWYVYLHNNPPESQAQYYFCTGFLVSGFILLVIGFGVGWIGRQARPAESSAAIASKDEAANGAAGAAGAAPLQGMPATIVPTDQVVAPMPIAKK